jgi:hypothetical protein
MNDDPPSKNLRLSDFSTEEQRDLLTRFTEDNAKIVAMQREQSAKFSEYLLAVSSGGVAVVAALLANFQGPELGRYLLIGSVLSFIVSLILLGGHGVGTIKSLSGAVEKNAEELQKMIKTNDPTLDDFWRNRVDRVANAKFLGIRPQPLRLWAYVAFVIGAALAASGTALPKQTLPSSPSKETIKPARLPADNRASAYKHSPLFWARVIH